MAATKICHAGRVERMEWMEHTTLSSLSFISRRLNRRQLSTSLSCGWPAGNALLSKRKNSEAKHSSYRKASGGATKWEIVRTYVGQAIKSCGFALHTAASQIVG